MRMRHGWLFPLMVLAASSVTAFGCIGIAAIIGYLPLSAPGKGNSAPAVAQAPAVALPADLAGRTGPKATTKARE
jgi:hypothetical protein